jgi:flagellar biosynthetic protein FliQ
MNPEAFVDVFREALGIVSILVSATIIPSLLVGLVVSIFQAATSINEQTLSFLPRLLVTLTALSFGAHWGLQQLLDFFQMIIAQIPEVLG